MADDPEALSALAGLYDDGCRGPNGEPLVKRDDRRAREAFASAADLGEPAVMTVVADGLTGPGHSAGDLARAETLYRRAFRQGYDTAAENLASTYLNLGRHRDAVRWFQLARPVTTPAPLPMLVVTLRHDDPSS